MPICSSNNIGVIYGRTEHIVVNNLVVLYIKFNIDLFSKYGELIFLLFRIQPVIFNQKLLCILVYLIIFHFLKLSIIFLYSN